MLQINKDLEKIIQRKLVKEGLCEKGDKVVSETYCGLIQKFTDTYQTSTGKMKRVKYCMRVKDISEKARGLIKRNVKRYCKANNLSFKTKVGLFSSNKYDCFAISYQA